MLMLKNTFCHISGIGEKLERDLWDQGLLSWEDVLFSQKELCLDRLGSLLRKKISESVDRLHQQDARFFSKSLSAYQQWRIFKEFRHATAYIDIETTGVTGSEDIITTVAMYDGDSLKCFVQGDNLQEFREAISNYRVLVTYNGRCFDVPVLRRYLHLPLDQAHIDLRFVLARLGFKGGLKKCEKQLGINRGHLNGLDGYDAVLLWNEFKLHRDRAALETLLAYNVLDAVNLEHLMITAYNLQIQNTPFQQSHQMDLPVPVRNPFRCHEAVVDKISRMRRPGGNNFH